MRSTQDLIEEVKSLKIGGGLSIARGTLRELILSRGWVVNDDSVGTVWSALNKMAYDFVLHVKKTLPKRIEKLHEANTKRLWKKNFINIEKTVPWCDDVNVSLYTYVTIETDELSLMNVEVKIRGNSKKYTVPLKDALARYVNTELEKNLK